MDLGSAGMPTSQHNKSPDIRTNPATDPETDYSSNESSSRLSAAGISMWAKSLKIPQPFSSTQEESSPGNAGKSALARFTSGIGLRLSPKSPPTDNDSDGASTTAQSGFIGTITKGLVDSSKNAVKAVQVKARHAVSQNKRRYQEGGFDLDLTYITENIIAMGFPAGDMSSGIFGYVEGFYRNHMEEVINFLETHHKEKYKVYNLCSERLYDASLFEGKVASFPFDDHNCPPIQLIISFCKSAYSWLKEDIENVVVVHCKAGMARTGLMISSLLLYLKFFPTAEESMDYYNQKRCIDGKGLVLPSQIRYVKYFERTFTYFNGENQPGRRCLLRGFRLHRCPYWVRPSITVSDHNGVLFSSKKHPRTKDLSSEDFWFSAPKKGVMVFALPGEPGLAELAGDFKIHFHDRQGDFYCWLNTTMIENRKILSTSDLDGFDKRKLPSPGFQVEVVLLDINTPTTPTTPVEEPASDKPIESTDATPVPVSGETTTSNKDDVFSDSEADESGSSRGRRMEEAAATPPKVAPQEVSNTPQVDSTTKANKVEDLTRETARISIGKASENHPNSKNSKEGSFPPPATTTTESSSPSAGAGEESYDFKAMAADASVFTFGDEEDDEDLL